MCPVNFSTRAVTILLLLVYLADAEHLSAIEKADILGEATWSHAQLLSTDT